MAHGGCSLTGGGCHGTSTCEATLLFIVHLAAAEPMYVLGHTVPRHWLQFSL
jgi:hypothetical protein